MRIIDADGSQLGILPIDKAIDKAKAQNLDLLLISDQSVPPVCKIVNFGQFRYQQQKKDKKAKKNIKSHVVKELKLTPKISSNDYNVRLTSCIKFLNKGYQVKITVFFKGREMSHPEIGKDLLNRFKEDINEYGEISTALTHSHRTMYIILNPK